MNRSAPQALVLIVDDDEMITTLLLRQLRRLEMNGHACHTIDSAMREIAGRSDDYCLAIVDYSMPDGNGLTLARQIHSLAPHLPIVLSSGDDSCIRDIELRDFGIVEFAPKPMTNDQFTRLIQERISLQKPS